MEMKKTGDPRIDRLIEKEAVEIRRLELFAARKAMENKWLIEKFHDTYGRLQALKEEESAA